MSDAEPEAVQADASDVDFESDSPEEDESDTDYEQRKRKRLVSWGHDIVLHSLYLCLPERSSFY